MPRKKILFISPWYPTEQSPHSGVFVREHAKAVQLYDDVVVLHCMGPDRQLQGPWKIERAADNLITQGIPTYRIWHRHLRIPKISYLAQLAGITMAFRQLAKSFHPDVIHAHVYCAAFPAAFVGKLTGTPVVITEHASAYGRKLLSWQELSLVRMAFSCAFLVAPVSESLRKTIQSSNIGAQCFQAVPNVVDTMLFHPIERTAHRDVARLVSVCVLDSSKNKGMTTLLQALALLAKVRTDWHLNHIGGGPAGHSYEAMATELRIADHVTFHGWQPKSEVAKWMQNASLVIVPSVYETFSVVAAEALASGVPVLCTRCGGPEDFVTDEVGMLVAPSDPKAMSEGLAQMLAMLATFIPERLSEYARLRFSPEQVGGVLHEIYLKACAQSKQFQQRVIQA